MYKVYERYATGFGERTARGLLFPLLKIAILGFILYLLITTVFLQTFRVDSASMQPTLSPGDRLLASPMIYGANIPLFKARLLARKLPKRGELVVVASPAYAEPILPIAAFEVVARFFSLQKGSIVRDHTGRRAPRYMLKRIIGLPGDRVKMSGYTALIKPRGASIYYEERELITRPYKIVTTSESEGWQEEFPFSGNMEEITLGEGEYFVLGDNRPRSSDSRSWGPLRADRIFGKVFYRYWPFNESGRL